MKWSIPISSVFVIFLFSSCSDLPVASFTHSADSYEAGTTIHFQSTCQNAINHDWDFGDGDSSSEENPTHIYTTEGEYQVRLIVSNEEGTDEVSKTLFITSPCWKELADLINSSC